MKVNVILADDHRLFLEGLKGLLARKEEINLIGTTSNGIELIKMVREYLPELIILDLNLPGKDGLECLALIKKNYPAVKVLVVSMYSQANFIKRALDLEVNGYILKSATRHEFFEAIDHVLKGKRFLGSGIDMEDRENTRKERIQTLYNDSFIKKYNLTKREIEILLLIAEAKSNKQIAKDLYISDQTVGVHRKNMMRKIGVGNTAGLIRFAYDKSILS